MGVPVVHFEIMGGPGEIGSRSSTAEVFGWKINSNNPMKYGVVDTGGGPGEINGGVGANQDGNKRVFGLCPRSKTISKPRWIG